MSRLLRAGAEVARTWPNWEVLEACLEIRLVETVHLWLLEPIGAKAHAPIFADDLAVGSLVEIFELEQFLGDDDVAFHADHFGDVRAAPGAVAQALDLDDEVDRVRDLARDRL